MFCRISLIIFPELSAEPAASDFGVTDGVGLGDNEGVANSDLSILISVFVFELPEPNTSMFSVKRILSLILLILPVLLQ